MVKQTKRDLLVALDIGTSKITVLVAELGIDETLEILGYAVTPSSGLKKGVVVNIDATVHSIQKAIEEAELMAGCQIHSAFTSIAGSHIRGLNSHGIVAIRNREVSLQDVERVIEAAKAVAIPADQQILHVLPQEFAIDAQDGIRDPVGMLGVRLESQVHMVTSAVTAVQNLMKCVERCGLNVIEIMSQPLAASYAVLTEDEKNSGVCLVDIGAGTTDVALFVDGSLRYTGVIPIAGEQVTKDIAVSLKLPTHTAENIKIQYGKALASACDTHGIEVAGVAEKQVRTILSSDLAKVIEARYEELFTLILHEIKRCSFADQIASGIVLTGAASAMPELMSLGERVFQHSVRIGYPQGIVAPENILENPAYATAVGLLRYASTHRLRQFDFAKPQFKHLLGRFKTWFKLAF